MPVSELTASLIIDEAKGEKDVGGVLVLESSLLLREREASFRKEIQVQQYISVGKISLHRNFGTYRFCFGGRRFFQELNART